MRQFHLYPYTLPTLHHNYCIAENFRGEKTLVNFTVLWLFAKVFSAKFGGMVSFGTAWASNPRKFSPRKSYFSPICACFLLRKFPAIRYSLQGNVGKVFSISVISSFGLYTLFCSADPVLTTMEILIIVATGLGAFLLIFFIVIVVLCCKICQL